MESWPRVRPEFAWEFAEEFAGELAAYLPNSRSMFSDRASHSETLSRSKLEEIQKFARFWSPEVIPQILKFRRDPEVLSKFWSSEVLSKNTETQKLTPEARVSELEDLELRPISDEALDRAAGDLFEEDSSAILWRRIIALFSAWLCN